MHPKQNLQKSMENNGQLIPTKKLIKTNQKSITITIIIMCIYIYVCVCVMAIKVENNNSIDK